MDIHVRSAGNMKRLPHRFCPGFVQPNHNVQVFWIVDENQALLRTPDRRSNCYIDIGYRVRIKPDHLYIIPTFNCVEIISDENYFPGLYFLNMDLYPQLHGNIFEIDLRASKSCKALLKAITAVVHEPHEILAPVINSLMACPEIVQTLDFNTNPNIRKVINYIYYNFNSPLNNSDLASIANYSINYFIKAFQEETGKSPHAYIQDVRLSNAMNMLLNGIAPKEVAALCGYSDQNVFYRTFKKHFSNPPSHYYRR